MGTVEAEKGQFRIEELTPDQPASLVAEARELLLEYGRFVVAQPGVARFCFGTLEKEAERLPLGYIEQGGGCLVAHAKGAPDAWELKRLWVRNEGRGLGLGRALTQAVIDRAVTARRRAVYLDTVPAAMEAAHRLYLDMGFTPCAAYNDNPVEGLAYLVKHL